MKVSYSETAQNALKNEEPRELTVEFVNSRHH